MRIRGAKTELEEAGLETDGMVESTAKLREEILALSGVDIMENANEFKSTYKIMDELAAKWENLTDIQQASVTELIAGKRQGNIVSSLMTNFDTARDALETSINSAGSAMQEHEKWQQSLEAQILKLKASWQGLSQSFMSSDFLKHALDGVIGLVDGITWLIDKIGTLPTLLGTFAATTSLFKNNGILKFDKEAKSIKIFGNAITGLNNKYTQIHTAIGRYNSISSKSVLFQEKYNKAMANSNTSIGKYLSGLNGAKASFSGYIGSLVGATVKTIALEAATVALNAAITMGISFAIQGLITLVTKWINANKELAESVDEITSKFEEQHNELSKLKDDYDTANESSMISKYEKLSKGVDNLGRNVSLTSEEYSEYQSIVNKIAEQMPSLVTGYDEQGNAILGVKGNVEELTEAYENLIKAQNNDVFKNVKDIGKDFKNVVNNAEKSDFWNNEITFDDIEYLKTMLSGKYTQKEVRKYINDNSGTSDGSIRVHIGNALKEQGVDVGLTATGTDKAIAETIRDNPKIIQRIIDDFENDLEEATKGMKTIAQATLSDAFDIRGSDYYGMSDTLQSVAKNIVDGFDFEFYKQYKDDPLGVQTYINDMLDQFNSIDEDGNAKIETAFNLKTQFNNGDVTYGEYSEGIQEAKNVIDGLELDDEVKSTIKLGFDDSEIQTQYNHIFGRLSNLYRDKDIRDMDRDEAYDYKFKAKENDKKVKEFLDSLTADEFAAIIDIEAEIDWENTSAKDIRKQIQEQVDINEALAFEASIETDTTALEAFNTALTESASAMGLSEESIEGLKSKYKDLDSFNPSTLFEKTANGVKVNRDELVKLEKEYQNLTKTEVKEHLDTLVGAYNDVTAEIDNCTNAGERAELLAKRDMYADQIEELATYQTQLEGVTGAYQRWLDAQNGPEGYDGYESIATSREDIEDEIDRGFISNKSKEYIDLLSGKDLVGGTIDDYAEAWGKLDEKVTSTGYSINDFFTVNDDGDITSTGIDRFFESVKKDIEGIYDTDTGVYDFSEDNLKKIQDEYGMGIEAIELLLEAAASAGYDIDWGGIFDDLDLDTSNFESLVAVAENAQKELNKLEGYEDLDFNFSTTNVEDATSELDKAQKVYNELVTGDDGDININAKGADNARVILSTLLVQKQQLEDSEIAINISTSGLDDSQAKAVAWVQDFRTKYKNLEIAISTGEGIEEAKTELETVKTSLGELDGDTAKIAAQLVLGEDTDTSGDGFKTQVNNAIKAIGEQDINVGFKLDETSIGGLNSNLLTNFTVDATAKITEVDKSQLETVETGGMVTWEENTDGVTKKFEANGTVNWDDNVKNVKTNFSASGTVKWTSGNNVKVKVISEANGTANANGTTQSNRSFARGDWGIKGSGTALVGELGMETLVRNGRFYTIGDNGAEFIKYRQGDIIFNHKQTEELFKNGKVTSDGGRGKMFVNGSAFVEGSYPSSGRAFWDATVTASDFASGRGRVSSAKTKTKTKKDDNSVTTTTETTTNINAAATESDYSKNKKVESSSSGSGSGSGSSEKTKEVLDWIEVAISRIEREIDKLDKKANNVYKSWSSRNEALVDEIDKVGDEIELQQSAYNRYIKEANSVGLSSSWASKVRNGKIDINTITDEKLKEKISSYKEWYEKALACQDAIDELKETESKLYAQRFENIQTQYDSILQGYEHTETMLNEYISQAEEKGHIVSKKYYNSLIANEKANIAKLKEEQSDLIEMRDEAVDSGKITKGSEAWYEQCAAIDEVTQAIEEGETSLLSYANSIREIDWQVFDLIQERIAAVSEEADFLIELMSNEKLFDDDGKLTGQGLATVGLHAQNYNTHMYAADEYGAEVANLNKQIASDPYDQELINRRNELIELQRESILAAEDEKNAIRDLVEEGINLELDALQERIDLHNEELDSMKDLYDYQKRVEESSKNIASLRKQLSSYEGDDSEEAKAKIQELKVSLEEAEADLEETEYDRYISDQQALLDTLYNEYETILNSRLDNIDYLLEGVIESVNAAASADGNIMSALGSEGAIAIAVSNNATSIKDTLASEAKNVGTTLSASMKDIWSVGEGNAKSVLTMYGDGFQKQQTTTNAVLNNIKADVNAMVDDIDKDAKKKTTANKTSTSAKKDPTKTTATTNKTTTTKKPSSSSGDGKPKVGDKVKFVSGKYYYDSEGKKPIGSKNIGKEVYITSINNKSWATHPYHISTGKKLGSGDLGWLKLNQLSGYATGKQNFLDNEIAWTQENGQEFIVRPSDGAILTPVAKSDSILTSVASKNIWDMANNPAEFIRDNLNLGSTGAPNNSTVQSNYTQYLDKVIFNMPNVKNYEEFMAALQKDKNFERLVDSMTIKKMTGGSSIAKSKAIR